MEDWGEDKGVDYERERERGWAAAKGGIGEAEEKRNG